MKKTYSKPTIIVEKLQIDQPLANGCTADVDDMNALVNLGYFTAEGSCMIQIGEGTLPGYDTICYHSNVQTAFMS